MKSPFFGAVCAGILTALSGTAHAIAVSGQGTWETTLQARDLDGVLSTAEAYYDTFLDITWLADANYAQTSGYDADGLMDWTTATAWAASLDVNGVTGWRLPTTNDVGNDGATFTNSFQGVDYGYNITAYSEMSHLFYSTLGDLAYYDTLGNVQASSGLTNTGLFSNIQSAHYWSATSYSGYAWIFDFYGGLQGYTFTYTDAYAWAVHTGDVGVPAAVPVPAALWLLGSGLLGLMGVSGKRRR